MDRFNPSKKNKDFLIGRTYKIKNWKPEQFYSAEPEKRLEVLRTWNETDQRIKEELLEAV